MIMRNLSSGRGTEGGLGVYGSTWSKDIVSSRRFSSEGQDHTSSTKRLNLEKWHMLSCTTLAVERLEQILARNASSPKCAPTNISCRRILRVENMGIRVSVIHVASASLELSLLRSVGNSIVRSTMQDVMTGEAFRNSA